MRAWFSKDNLPLTSLVILAVIGAVQTAAFVFDWHLPWDSRTGVVTIAIGYVLVFSILHRRRAALRIAWSRSLGQITTWLLVTQLLVLVWLTFVTWVVAKNTLSLASLWSEVPQPSAIPESQAATTSPPPSATAATNTPSPFLADDFLSQAISNSVWQSVSCPAGSPQVLNDRLRISIASPAGSPQRSCVLEARLRSATVLKAELHLTIREGSSDLGYAGLIASCGGAIANFLLTPSDLQINISGAGTSQLLFFDAVPYTRTLVIEWQPPSMTFASVEDAISQTLPCPARAQYVKIGAIAAAGGTINVDLLDFRLWASTATPTP